MTHGRTLHVLQVTKRYPGAVGGDATAVAGLERALQGHGHRITIVTSRSPSIMRRHNVHQIGLPSSDAALDHVGPARMLSCFWTMLWGLWVLRRERPDVVHAHAPDLGAAIALPARALGVPRVLTLHGTSISTAAKGLRPRLERLLVRLGDYHRLFTVDPVALPHLVGLARTAPEFVPNGVTVTEYPAWRGPRPSARLLFVGRLEAVKSVDVLLAAMKLIRSQGCAAGLDVVGAGRLEPDLRRLASELDLDDSVAFLGTLARADVMERMVSAAALVLPSSYEGFPMVVLEAWAVGLPVIATAVGAVPEVCSHGQDALVVDPQDPTGLAGAIATLLADASLAKRIGGCGHRAVKSYSEQEVGAYMQRQYLRLLSAAD
jgi:glycosyltransferase involved in cell wall biosynthesis